MVPGVPLPPQPILTLWRTWLSAVGYCSQHICLLKCVLEEITEDVASIKMAGDLLSDGEIGRDLCYIDLFTVLEKGIRKLKTAGMPLREFLDVVQKLEKIDRISGKTDSQLQKR